MNQEKDVFAGRALDLFKARYHCSESTCMGLVEYLGIESELFPGIASGFHGGFGLSGLVCGALSSAVMALGIRFGRDDPSASPWSATDKVNLLVKDFRDNVGALLCPDIIQCDVWDAIQLNDYLSNRRIPVCGEKVVRFAVTRTIEIMEMPWPPPEKGRTAGLLAVNTLSVSPNNNRSKL